MPLPRWRTAILSVYRLMSWRRVTAVLLTPYPPGIPLLIPGERFNATICSYLRFAREFNATFPGFETDVHGLVKGADGTYYVDCVR
jgi:arginine decarboxylase